MKVILSLSRLMKVGSAAASLLIFCGCLAFTESLVNTEQMPVSDGATATKTPGHAPNPWPPYLATYHYSLGVLHSQEDDYAAAIKEFEAALRHDPESAEIAAELASAYAEKGDVQKAIAVCKESLSHNPHDIDLNMLLGGLYMGTHDLQGAVAQYRKVVALDPKHVNARLYLGTVYGDARMYRESLAVFNELLSIDPEHLMANYYRGKVLLELGELGEAEKAFKRTIAIRPNFEPALIELAHTYEKQNKGALAIGALNDYISLFPDRLNARIKLGELLLRQKRYGDAERELKKVLKIDRSNREVRLTLGLLYLESGRYDEAIRAFSDLKKDFPLDFRYPYLLASAYEGKKDSDAAIRQLKTIPVKSDLYGNARVQIGMILKKQDRRKEAKAVIGEAIKAKKEAVLFTFLSVLQEEEKDIAAAERTLRDGLLALHRNVELHYALGVLYEKNNRFEESIREMESVLKIDPNHADALNFIGYSYADRGIRLDEAEKMIRKALQLKPGSGYIIDSLGWIYFRQNKIGEALKYLREAAAAMPEDSAIAEHLGDALLKDKRAGEALEVYRGALKLSPGNKSLQKKIDDLRKQK